MNIFQFNLRRWIILAIAVLCIGLNIAVFAFYKKNQALEASEAWVEHTYNVTDKTSNFFYHLQDMHLAQRGFLLTGDPDRLARYRSSKKLIQQLFAELVDLTGDNDKRQKDFRAMEKILARQNILMEEQVAARQRNERITIDSMNANKKIVDDLRNLKDKITKDERVLFIERSKIQSDTRENYVSSIFATAGVSIFGLLLANAFIGFLSVRRANAESAVRRINKEMESFTYIASHDLRSPLVNMRGFASEIQMDFEKLKPILEKSLMTIPDDEKQIAETILNKEIPSALDYIHTSVEKMDKLTSGILELSRIGKRELKINPVNMTDLVTRTLKAFHHQITTKNIDITVLNLPNIVSDTFSLEQVFGNIIDNAIKYLDPSRQGKIEIGGQKGRSDTVFWVKDNGRGISQNDLKKIFEIYRRAGNNPDVPGEGLGMAYVRTTLRRLGGQIWCESAKDVGTVFYFTIANNWKKDTLDD